MTGFLSVNVGDGKKQERVSFKEAVTDEFHKDMLLGNCKWWLVGLSKEENLGGEGEKSLKFGP